MRRHHIGNVCVCLFQDIHTHSLLIQFYFFHPKSEIAERAVCPQIGG